MGDAEILQAFRACDKDGDGIISPTDMVQVLRDFGKNVNEPEARQICETLDFNNDGIVDFDDFAHSVRAGVSWVPGSAKAAPAISEPGPLIQEARKMVQDPAVKEKLAAALQAVEAWGAEHKKVVRNWEDKVLGRDRRLAKAMTELAEARAEQTRAEEAADAHKQQAARQQYEQEREVLDCEDMKLQCDSLRDSLQEAVQLRTEAERRQDEYEVELDSLQTQLNTAEQKVKEQELLLSEWKVQVAAAERRTEERAHETLEQMENSNALARDITQLEQRNKQLVFQLEETQALVKSQRETIEQLNQSAELIGSQNDSGSLGGFDSGGLAAEAQAAEMREMIDKLSAAVMGSNQLVLDSVREAIHSRPAGALPAGGQSSQLLTSQAGIGADWKCLDQNGGALGFAKIPGCEHIAKVAAGVLSAASNLEGEHVGALQTGLLQLIGNEHALVQSRLRGMQLEAEVGKQKAQFQLDEVERLDKSLKEAKLHYAHSLKQSHEEWRRSVSSLQRGVRVSKMVLTNLITSQLHIHQHPAILALVEKQDKCKCSSVEHPHLNELSSEMDSDKPLAIDSPSRQRMEELALALKDADSSSSDNDSDNSAEDQVERFQTPSR